jgi:predicted metal-dependent hydrolase
MKDFSSFFILLILVTIFYLYLESKASEVTYVEAKDGDTYLVRNLPDKLQAANLLSDMKKKLTKLVNHAYKNRNDKYKDKKVEIERLKKNYRPDAISESSPSNKYTSYSINKGKKIVYCIRSKTVDNTLVDLNTMMFVAIHELGHLASREIGHVPPFWDNMKYLLEIGIEIGVYKKVDYAQKNVPYCGTKITDTPLD